MATIHISKDEAARDMAGLLSRVNAETTFLIEDGAEPIAILAPPPPRSPSPEERLASIQLSDAVMDEDFARDVEDAIAYYRQPIDADRLG